MIIMTPTYNYESPPVNWTTLLNYWKLQKMTKYFKSHTNITKVAMTMLTVTIPVQTNTTQLVKTIANGNHATQRIR